MTSESKLDELKRLCQPMGGEPMRMVSRLELLALVADAERLNSRTIRIEGFDEFGYPTACLHKGIDLRAAIDKAIEESRR